MKHLFTDEELERHSATLINQDIPFLFELIMGTIANRTEDPHAVEEEIESDTEDNAHGDKDTSVVPETQAGVSYTLPSDTSASRFSRSKKVLHLYLAIVLKLILY